MWSNVLAATNLAFVWLAICFAGYLIVQSDSIGQRFLVEHLKGGLYLVLILALLVRIIPTLILPVGAAYDIESFRLVAEALLSGEDVYTSAAVGRHPYLPLQMYPIGLALYLAQKTVVPFIVWIKLPAILADLMITAVLYRASYIQNQTTAFTIAALYAFNPISYLTSAYHGQFDAIPSLLLLFAWYANDIQQRSVLSAISLGFAILSKSWPAFFLPIILWRMPNHKKRGLFLLITLAIPLLFTTTYVVIFKTDPIPMLSRALTHTGVPGYWGLSAILKLAAGFWETAEAWFLGLQQANRPLLLAVGLLVLWHTRRQPSLAALTTTILCLFAISIGMGLQWLLWVVPFAILSSARGWLNAYTFFGTLFLIIQLYGYHLYNWANILLTPDISQILIRLSAIPVWLVIVFWTIHRLRDKEAISFNASYPSRSSEIN